MFMVSSKDQSCDFLTMSSKRAPLQIASLFQLWIQSIMARNCAFYDFSKKWSILIQYVAVCDLQDASATDRTLDLG